MSLHFVSNVTTPNWSRWPQTSQAFFGNLLPRFHLTTGRNDNRYVICRHTRTITLFKAVILSVWDHGCPNLHVFNLFYRRFLQRSPSVWTQNCNSRRLQHMECNVSVGNKKTVHRRNGNSVLKLSVKFFVDVNNLEFLIFLHVLLSCLCYTFVRLRTLIF